MYAVYLLPSTVHAIIIIIVKKSPIQDVPQQIVGDDQLQSHLSTAA